jgi:hypothetical protein
MPLLSREGNWVVICGDLKIFTFPPLREVWMQCKLTTYFLKKGWINQPLWTQAWWLVRWWPSIMSHAGLSPAGYAFEIPAQPTGKIRPLPGLPVKRR